MKQKILTLTVLLLAVCAGFTIGSNPPPATATAAWGPSPSTGVTNYRVYWSTTSGSYTNSIDVGLNLSAAIPNLTRGVAYYFVGTAWANGFESQPASEVQATPPAVPMPQGSMVIIMH